MAIIIPFDCPFCDTKRVSFVSRYDWSVPGDGVHKLFLGVCNACSSGVIFKLCLTRHVPAHDFINTSGDIQSNGMLIADAWPRIVSDQVPADVPEQVGSLFRQAQTCIRQMAWDAAGMTLRKTLEVSTKGLDPTLACKSLAARIDALHTNGKLTADVRDWAHEIRLDGNNAVHDEEPFTPEQTENLRAFVESYLRYTYSLPALVAQNRAKRTETVGK